MSELSVTWPLSTAYAFNFLLVLARVGALVGTMPVISGRSVPMMVKAGLAVVVSLILLSANWQTLAPEPETWAALAGALLQHMAVGLVIGFSAGLAFAALQVAGQLLGMQIGFSLAMAVDPVSEQQASVLDQVYGIVAALIFLAIDGHHWVLQALQSTFDIVPLDQTVVTMPTAEALAAITAKVPLIGVQVAFPVMAALVVADVALGVLSRIAPQVNVFVVGMPLKVGLGLLAMALTVNWPALALRDSLMSFLLMAERFWG